MSIQLDEEKLIAINPNDVLINFQTKKSKIIRLKESLINLMIIISIILLLCMTLEVSNINNSISYKENINSIVSRLNNYSNEIIDISEIPIDDSDVTPPLNIATNIREEHLIDDVDIININHEGEVTNYEQPQDNLQDLERLEELRLYQDTNDHPDWQKQDNHDDVEKNDHVSLNW
ncbi:hypothetical protein BN7_1758 [Wickerhamomyces ciferrii]|uniref:Uncharacterized protein n=1 Tax=Wickerhamomyces ciferrii (strain ATCC 14091 / BCRC 22168 / CBS 111 / JCM 3599 / NBRC 0793 / NRRL Y-1031 F-60-10) TaxID=1206466 RepID=K0KLH2_WICCF|nr:uncharacterized protein BN7_1758 [Wickerhamomyces ciferrii]CCH42214.1 hypothetical protein BN7_1758 [Wickerhamomyces ciferrii]